MHAPARRIPLPAAPAALTRARHANLPSTHWRTRDCSGCSRLPSHSSSKQGVSLKKLCQGPRGGACWHSGAANS
jgi:hypothetical protein